MPSLLQILWPAMTLLALSAVISPLLAGRRKLAGVVNFAFTAGAAILLLRISFLAIFISAGNEAQTVHIGRMAVPFLIDGFSGIFIAAVAVLALAGAFFSIGYMEHYREYGLRGYYLCFPLFVLGMVTLLTVDDLSAGFTFAWQLMTLSSYFLIRFERRKIDNIRIANRYLALMELAWLAVAGGALLIRGAGIGDSLHLLAGKTAQTPGPVLIAVFGLLLFGFGMKAGVFPLGQLWLPGAHSVAPSPVSALLSGAMLKTGIYGLMRTFFFMAPASGAGWSIRTWGMAIASIGAATLFIGTLQSVKQSDAKRLLAYSSIGQIGYIVLAAGAALWLGGGNEAYLRGLAAVAVIGALFHVVNHAVFKGLLFLASGSILYSTGTKDLNKLGGLIKFMPVSAAVAGIASLAVSGIPPFSGFASKWAIISSSFLAADSAAVLMFFGIVALFTSAVTLACYVKFFGMAFTSTGAEFTTSGTIKEVPAVMLIPKLFLALISLVQGLLPVFVIRIIASAVHHSPGFSLGGAFESASAEVVLSVSFLGVRLKDVFTTGVIAAASPIIIFALLSAALLAANIIRKLGGSREVAVPTWLGGYQTLNDANRFADRGLFAPLKSLFSWTGGTGGERKSGNAPQFDPGRGRDKKGSGGQ
ncbi:MAG: proton-conducting transporter membrane subunit [Acidobacteriota bacterium]|nr:proton-conducting transporter membrane subunit [Acidobacteriota bacterium]